jgi:hypothetical protein
MDAKRIIARAVRAESRGNVERKTAAVEAVLLDDRVRAVRAIARENGLAHTTLTVLVSRVKSRLSVELQPWRER